MESFWIAVLIAITATVVGLMLGGESAEARISHECALQGSFVIDGKVYDCTPRTKQ